jgi:hypothetical protein
VSDNGDQLVADYLSRLSAAAGQLPAGRREELIEEISAHIAEARMTAADGPAAVRTVLDDLGDPEEIVGAAEATPGSASSRAGDRPPGYEIVTVVLLLIGGLVVPVLGWIVGVVMLWASNRWRISDKLLGTLIWPGGLAAPFAVLVLGAGLATLPASVCYVSGRAGPGGHQITTTNCTPAVIPPWLAITIFAIAALAALLGPVLVAIRLMRRARRGPAPSGGADQGMTHITT